jgi:hypothetical protein
MEDAGQRQNDQDNGRRKCMLLVLSSRAEALTGSPIAAAGGADQDRGEAKWVTVKEWSGGSGQTKTEAFRRPGRPWRVSFNSTAGERFGIFEAAVRTPADDRLIAGVFGVQADEQGIVGGAFQVDSDHEEYVLEIASQGLQWRLAIERR